MLGLLLPLMVTPPLNKVIEIWSHTQASISVLRLSFFSLMNCSLQKLIMGERLLLPHQEWSLQIPNQVLLRRKCRDSASQSSAHVGLILPGTSDMLDCTVGEVWLREGVFNIRNKYKRQSQKDRTIWWVEQFPRPQLWVLGQRLWVTLNSPLNIYVVFAK